MGTKERKAELRRQISALRKSLGREVLREQSVAICLRLMKHPLFRSASTLLLFSPLPDEPDISRLIRSSYPSHRILLPAVTGEASMELREYRGEESMHRGAFGIMEPMGKRFTALSEISLAVIPGVAFDAKGNRLGRGRGYYDRLLPALKKSGVTTSGICFDFQILSSLPCEDHDIPVDFLI